MGRVIPLLAAVLVITACTLTKPSVPTGIYSKEQPKVPPADAAFAQVPAGYKVEVFMKDLIWPTSIDFDEAGNTYARAAASGGS
ncbi:MAG TPA: hypothetical protein VFS25_22045 [Chitinophaga sp.]|uniref:hypothetical protein n=1 Tax=Chitinophaga sp. TaxID=1869181 RepID=UPI002DBD6337|nr:hypothetical protein [Chitinophaga sp.]HEU4555543.1 hypothetical protein [Chitinophaga sp.]